MRIAYSLAIAALAIAGSVAAQTQTISIKRDSNSLAVPQTTIVPVQQSQSTVVTESTTVYDTTATRREERRAKQAIKARMFASKIDSLVQSRNYVIYPVSMQEYKSGDTQLIYNDNFYFGVLTDHVEMNMPTERGISQYVEVLTFDDIAINDYQASQTQSGWNVWFSMAKNSTTYNISIVVSKITGEVTLDLVAPSFAMQYVGSLWQQGVPNRQ